MSWADLHRESERHASDAAEAMRRGELTRADACFEAAARAEAEALLEIGPDKPRTLAITSVSAVSLFYKAGRLQEAALLAHRMSATPGMPRFAQDALKELLLTIWDEQSNEASDPRRRVRALQGIQNGEGGPVLRWGSLVLHLDRRAVFVGESELRLTLVQYSILEFLVLNEGTVRTKDDILSQLYPEGDRPDVKIVDVFIAKLRKKLSAVGLDGLIETVWSHGYVVFPPRKEAQPTRRALVGAGRSSAA